MCDYSHTERAVEISSFRCWLAACLVWGVRESPVRGWVGLSAESASCFVALASARRRVREEERPFAKSTFLRECDFFQVRIMATRTAVNGGGSANNKPDLANKNKRMAYNMYRGMLTQFNAQANAIIENLPPERVTFDQGVDRQILGMM